MISGDGQTLGKLHYDHYENALAMVKGAKEVILFDPRNNHQLYATQLQQAKFEVTKNNGLYELVPRGLQERNCYHSNISMTLLYIKVEQRLHI